MDALVQRRSPVATLPHSWLFKLGELCSYKKQTRRMSLNVYSLWTLLFRMRRSGLVFSMLVFATAVYSAAIKGQNEDFLNFLNEAFNRNSPEPIVTVSVPSNPVGVPDPITVCSTSNSMENPTDTADENCKENSKSADQTETLELENDSDDSKSAERTIMDKYVKTETEKQPSITQEDRSQEMHGRWDSVTDQTSKRRKDTERGREEQRVTQITETMATKMDSSVPDKLRDEERNRKVKAVMTRKDSNSILVSDSQNIIDQSQECEEESSWMTGYPDGENTSVDDAGVDLQSEERVTKYEHQPRKLCGARKRLRTPRPQREQLDTEKGNSELQDRDSR